MQPIKTIWQRILSLVTSKRVAWACIAFGVALRAAEYLLNSALYVDEGALAMNLINRSFAGLFQPLDANQAAPAGFLVLEKAALLAFGLSEYALRLFPFLFSIAALILFYSVARRVLAEWAVPLALLFFAASGQVVHYAAQVKQYSSDVAITLLIVLVGLHIKSKELTIKRVLLIAFVGVIVVWFSHPSVFVLAGVGTTLMLAALKRKDWPRVWKLAACSAMWVASFATFYLLSLKNLSANLTLEASWMKKGTFMPLPPTSVSDLEWYPSTFFKIFSNPVGSPFPFVAGLVFIVGCIALLKRNKTHLLMLISPVLFTLAASSLHKYPFGRRLLLFLLPLILIVIAAGIEFVIERAKPYSVFIGFVIFEVLFYTILSVGALALSWKRLLFFIAVSLFLIAAAAVLYVIDMSKLYAAAIGSVIAFFLLLQPVGGATRHMLNPRSRQDVRPILAHIRDNRQTGDLIYVYHREREPFRYYAPRYGFAPNGYVLGIDARGDWKGGVNESYNRDLDQLRGRPRVWIVFAEVRNAKGQTDMTEEDYFVSYLDSIGVRLDKFKRAGASVYLYDLSNAK